METIKKVQDIQVGDSVIYGGTVTKVTPILSSRVEIEYDSGAKALYPIDETLVMEDHNPLGYTHMVVERYKDGGVWKHAYFSQQDAERNMAGMQEANKGRTYELVEL